MSFIASICIFALSIASVAVSMRMNLISKRIDKLERQRWLDEQRAIGKGMWYYPDDE